MPLPPDRAPSPDQQDQARQDSRFLHMTLAVFLGLLITVTILYLLNALGLGAYFPVNADSWLRLLRVRALMEGEAWYTTPLVEAIDPPYGLISPWTRAGDLPLWGLASALVALAAIPTGTALTAAATLWNLAMAAGAIFTLLWATRILDFSPSTRAIMVSLLFVSPFWVLVFEFGSADYHGMSVVIFLACLGYLWRIQKAPTRKPDALILGLLITLGVWISVDFMVPGLLIICALGLGWVTRAHGIRPLIVTSLTTAILLIPCLFIEQSPQTVFKTEYDTLSIVYISMWGGVAGIALVLGALSQHLTSPAARLGTSCLVAGGVLWLLLAQFPEILMGPMASVQSRDYYNYEITPFGALKNNDFIPIVILACCAIYGMTKTHPNNTLKISHKTILFLSMAIALLFF